MLLPSLRFVFCIPPGLSISKSLNSRDVLASLINFNSFASQGVGGTLFFQGQRLFFHNATGKYGSIPLTISGDMDINPDDGEYRLSCQVSFLILVSSEYLINIYHSFMFLDVIILNKISTFIQLYSMF